MKVELAGFNVPINLLSAIKTVATKVMKYDTFGDDKKRFVLDVLEDIGRLERQFTPEVITAAYARASRSDENLDKLIEKALISTDEARRSVCNIIGMGHFSIADHSTFNFTIMGTSRLMVEEIEHHRIATGYTEKSQRYVTFEGDYLIPEELSKEDSDRFQKVIESGIKFYKKYNKKIFTNLKNENKGKIKQLEKGKKEKELEKFLKQLENSAKEDARYTLSLATHTQLGCSYPGETLELAIRRNKYGWLAEQKEFAEKLYQETVKIAPSLIQLTDPKLYEFLNKGKKLEDDNFKFTRKHIEQLVEKTIKETKELPYVVTHQIYGDNILEEGEEDVKLIQGYGSQDYDLHVIAALIHANSLVPAEKAYKLAKTLTNSLENGQNFIKDSLRYVGKHDKVPREFEMPNGFVYEIVLSASAFAQLKRHRMMTLLKQEYNPELGYTIPRSIKEIGSNAVEDFFRTCNQSSKCFYELKKKHGRVAESVLTNAHMRRVLIGINPRELYHFSRVRCDEHAQWDIRYKSKKMVELAKLVAPGTTMFLGGKDEFPEIRKSIYGEE